MSQHLHARMEQIAQLPTPTLSRPKLTTNGDELPEAVVVEDVGAAMAGFVGLLRQLGDLAQLAAEVFHGLHDQATAASARARGLTLRARRLEERLRHGHGVDRRCASARPANHGVIVSGGGTRPRSIAEHIRRCRRPPQLSMLDKYDAGGEGACLKRYTDPSFFRTHSAEHEHILQETKPEFQSADKCSKFKTVALLRQIKYQHIIRRIRHQMHGFRSQDSSEARILSSVDSPEPSNTRLPCSAVPVKERSSDLVERTSSFRAWLSPGAACTHACVDITQGNADGVASHGANKANENANIATNSRSALIDFIASRVESSPRKLSAKKRSDPLTESFRSMARKLLLENESVQNFRNNELVHSEDVPNPDEVAFDSKSAEET